MTDLDTKPATLTRSEPQTSRWPGAHWLIPVIVAGLAFVGPSVATPDRYTETVLVMIAIFAVLALSTDLLLGRLGLPSMANGALFAVGAYTLSILTAQHEQPFWSSFVIAIVVSAFVGLVLGLITMRSSGHYFAVSSLAFAGSIVVFITAWSDVTRGAAGIFNIGRPEDLELGPLTIELSTTRGQYYLALTLLVVSLVGVHLLDRGNFGRRSGLIKVDPVLAGSLGVNVFTAKLKSFTISAAMAGAAGALYASFISYIDPGLASHLTGFNALVYCIVGGTGRLFGPLIGTVLVLGLTESLRIADDMSQLLIGIALILILLFMKEGVAGTIDKILGPLLGKARTRTAPTTKPSPADVGEARQVAVERDVQAPRSLGEPALAARGMTKAYGGVRAVEDASIDVHVGEIVGVMGPNGAGKSTLFGMIAGTIAASAGQVSLGGAELRSAKSFRRSRLGIGRTFQTNRVLLDRTVLENIRAARLSKHKRGLDQGGEQDVVEELVTRTFLADRAHTLANELTVEEQRLLGVAMALATEPKVLLLDEPFAGLREVETPRLQAVLEGLRADGMAVILVEHKLKVLMALSDRVFALDRGRIIAEGTPDQVMNDDLVIDAYLGRAHVEAQ